MGVESFFDHSTIDPRLAGEIAVKALDLYERKEPGLVLEFGFREIDQIISMIRGNYYLIAARPGIGKCLGKGTRVLMFDGSLKNVEDVVNGDVLMGPDSRPRIVQGVTSGREEMYWIHQKHGISYRVNKSHILSLRRASDRSLLNISVSDILDGKIDLSQWRGWKATPGEDNLTGVTIEPDGMGDYYGFTLDGDGLFLLEDMTVTHNTAFLLQLISNIAAQLPDDMVIWVASAEMTVESLALREACAKERLPYWKAVKGGLTKDEYARLRARMRQGMGCYVDASPAPTLEHMVQELDTLKKSGKRIGAVLFDYLQLAGELDRSEKERIDKISKGLAAIAKKFGCVVLALGQTNRSTPQGDTPTLSSLMYGGEQQPSGVIILDRPHMHAKEGDPEYPQKDLVDVWILKHRHGPSGFVNLLYEPETMRFRTVNVERIHLNRDY